MRRRPHLLFRPQVAWFGPREGLRNSLFSATVYVSEAEQDAIELAANGELHPLPPIFAGETQIAAGDGLPPPSEPFLDGLEPPIPAVRQSEVDGEPRSIGTLLDGILPARQPASRSAASRRCSSVSRVDVWTKGQRR